MYPTNFPQANKKFGAPEQYSEEQVGTVHACVTKATRGNLDGQDIIVVAWQPTSEEIQEILAGHLIYLTMFGTGLVPHCLTTSFQEASFK